MYKIYKFSRLFLVLGIFLAFGFDAKSEYSDLSYIKANQNQQKNNVTNNKVLLGNWERTDSDYKIKIYEVTKDGKMKAGYFNPKYINVSKASWTNSKAVLKIYVELRDKNYPGSNYTLIYYPEKDMLAGKYFQAVSGEAYDVLFTRIK
jgi:hypothetical protein